MADTIGDLFLAGFLMKLTILLAWHFFLGLHFFLQKPHEDHSGKDFSSSELSEKTNQATELSELRPLRLHSLILTP
jgi:hypothetical protein